MCGGLCGHEMYIFMMDFILLLLANTHIGWTDNEAQCYEPCGLELTWDTGLLSERPETVHGK